MEALKEQFLPLELYLMYYLKQDFSQLLAEGFLEFGSSGGKIDQAFQLNNITDDGLTSPFLTVTDFSIRVLDKNLMQTLFVTTHNETEKKQTAAQFSEMKKSYGACAFTKAHLRHNLEKHIRALLASTSIEEPDTKVNALLLS